MDVLWHELFAQVEDGYRERVGVEAFGAIIHSSIAGARAEAAIDILAVFHVFPQIRPRKFAVPVLKERDGMGTAQ